MNPTLANALGTVLAALLVALTPVLVVLATRAAQYLASLAKFNLSTEQTAQIEWAVRTSVDAAQEVGEHLFASASNKGELKLQHARITARSLAPAATSKLDEAQLTNVINAAVERKRSSTPSVSLMPIAGTNSLIPLSLVPMRAGELPLPPPSSVPSFETAKTPLPPRRP